MILIPRKLKNVFAALFPQFARIPHDTRVDTHLYGARVDLLEAEHNAEYWVAHRDMLRGRVSRLEVHQEMIAAEHGLQFNLPLPEGACVTEVRDNGIRVFP